MARRRKIKNGQTAMGKPGRRSVIDAAVIGAAMGQSGSQEIKMLALDRCPVQRDDARYPAHVWSSILGNSDMRGDCLPSISRAYTACNFTCSMREL